jgi:Sec-independent protein secretion pathway component TatC
MARIPFPLRPFALPLRAPLVVALVTDFLLKDEAMLRYSMASFALIMAPGGAFLMYLAMKPFGREVMRAQPA